MTKKCDTMSLIVFQVTNPLAVRREDEDTRNPLTLADILCVNMLKIANDFKTKAWSRVEKTNLGAYQHQLPQSYAKSKLLLQKYILPAWNTWEDSIAKIVAKEIDGPLQMKGTKDNSFLEKDMELLEQYIRLSQSANPYVILKSITDLIPDTLPKTVPMVEENCKFPTATFIALVWHELLEGWQLGFKEHLMKSLQEKFQQKLDINKGFYNLTTAQISESMIKTLQHGDKYKPSMKSTLEENQKYFTEYTWDLVIWAAKQISNKTVDLQRKDEKALEETLCALANTAPPLTEGFWKSILNDYKQYMQTTSNLCNENPKNEDLERDIPYTSYKELEESAVPDGTILTTADKNYGMVLLYIKDLLRGEREILESLGAKQVAGINAMQLNEKIDQEYKALREGTSDCLTKALAHFPPMQTKVQQLPFLKLNPKIHKMTAEQIESKNAEVLQFRPICDSKFAVTKPGAQAAASLLVKLKRKVVFTHPQMRHFYPLSGFEVSLETRTKQYPTDAPYSLIISCDLSNAYSNIWLDDVIKCSRFLSAAIGNDPEEQEMIEILTEFVLRNNYIECSNGIFSFDPVLPMGSCISGDALDIVAMAGELLSLVKPPLSDHALALVPPYLSKDSCKMKANSYDRYRDDTLVLLSGEKPDQIISSMKRLATDVFPPRIPISFEYGSFMMSFLNCCFHIHFPGRGFTTYPRLNFARPSIMAHISSNSWEPHLTASYMSSTVTAFRICSDETMFKNIQKLLEKELALAGHTDNDIIRHRMKTNGVLERIRKKDMLAFLSENDFDEENIQGTEEQEKYRLPSPFPPPVVYDRNNGVFQTINNMVNKSRLNSGLVFYNAPVKTQPSLKQILVNKNMYRALVKQHIMNDVNNR